jgi:hypothetical protein
MDIKANTREGINMKKITISSIKKLNPCKSGIDNLIKHYPKFKGNEVDFLKLEHIPYDDKIWLMTNIKLDDRIWQYWALACASSQLDNTNDVRVRQCLEVVEAYLNGDVAKEELLAAARSAELAAWSAARLAARSAAWSAAWSAAESAAWSSARSARSAVESAASAVESAAESAGAAARSAELAAYSAWSSARSDQEEVNILLLIDVIEELHG